MWTIALFKPFLYLWAGLNFIDDLALIIRVGRLGASVIPIPGKSEQDMCGVCDDVVGDLLAGKEGISAIPCTAACLGIKKCIEMCERVKTTSESSTEFPCVAAGFCDPIASGYVDSADIDCKSGALFSCQPKQFCRRKREKFKMRCELRPGIGRWNGMKHLASQHTVALAEGLKKQLYCGEAGAGEFCIARPTGTGLLAESIGLFIALVIGGYKTIEAIETPGGDDDRQWLTFWLIFALWLFFETYFARVILSNIPFYYECKLGCLIWLIWKHGAERCYRRLRRIPKRILRDRTIVWSENSKALESLEIMRRYGGEVVEKQLALQSKRESIKKETREWEPDQFWDYDPSCQTNPTADPISDLLHLSKFLISAEGSKQLEESSSISESEVALLIERSAQILSFQPRYLHIHLDGTIDEPRGMLPVMDLNGKADGYVTCHLITQSGISYPPNGVTSRTCYRTRSPKWNQDIEIPLDGGTLDRVGYFSHHKIGSTRLHFCVHDADVGIWCWVYFVFRVLVVTSVVLGIIAYAEGATDDANKKQQKFAFVFAVFLLIGYLVGYYMAVFHRLDDEVVGFCIVPLGVLLDQKQHSLLLTLQPQDIDSKTNLEGVCGVIRVKLMLTEN